jgi:hypothetical protein
MIKPWTIRCRRRETIAFASEFGDDYDLRRCLRDDHDERPRPPARDTASHSGAFFIADEAAISERLTRADQINN